MPAHLEFLRPSGPDLIPLTGERVVFELILRPDDEITLGRTRVIFRADDLDGQTETDVTRPAPSLTARERDVLVSLCRPVLHGDPFTDPASVRQIAADLVVSEAAVKQHLLRLYKKFGVDEGNDPRRPRLANEAIARAAVTIRDLRDP